MKAYLWERYGPPETLRLADVEKPAPDAGEVLVKVLAGSINPADWHSLRGKPLSSGGPPWGCEQVVDYTETDFTEGEGRYDLILDTIGNRSVSDLRRALADGGRAAVTGSRPCRD